MSFRLVPKLVTLNDLERRNGPFCVILLNLVVSGAHCVKVIDIAITMDNLRLLCLVVNARTGTARCPRYKYSITARCQFRSRFINSRLNAQHGRDLSGARGAKPPMSPGGNKNVVQC